MRGRLYALSMLALVVAGCATSPSQPTRPIPGMDDSHRVEQINAGGSRSWN